MLRITLFICIAFTQTFVAQTMFVFHPCYGTAAITDTIHRHSDTLHFESLRFYISSIQVLNKGKTTWKEKNSYHLLDAFNEKSLAFKLMIPPSDPYDEIQFHLGVDSVTNVSGALAGDLDPTKGMYWTWQSGYINLKLEGTSGLCQTRNHAFEFHLGGYLPPFASLQTITLSCNPNKTQNIYVDVSRFIRNVDLATENQVMSPGERAVELSKKARTVFSMTKP